MLNRAKDVRERKLWVWEIKSVKSHVCRRHGLVCLRHSKEAVGWVRMRGGKRS